MPTADRSALRYAVGVTNGHNLTNAERSDVGLCLNCRHLRRITSDRGSTFFFCKRSATDPRFPKYPRLPVSHCSGYGIRQTKRMPEDVRCLAKS